MNKSRHNVVIFVAVLAVLTLAGCENPSNKWLSSEPVMLTNVKGFEDCRYTSINTGRVELYAIRCPNSTVNTTKGGKNAVHITTVEDN